jgi:hypothetical protein
MMNRSTPSPEKQSASTEERETVIAFLPGFTWGNKSTNVFEKVLEKQSGIPVLSAEYYDTSTRKFKDPRELGINPENATEILAANFLQTLEKEGLSRARVLPVEFSYGSLIGDASRRLGKSAGISALLPGENEGRRLIQIAPSGALPSENTAKIITRYSPNWLRLGADVGIKDPAFRQQAARLFLNPISRAREAWRLGNDTIDYSQIIDDGYMPHALLFPGDTVFKPSIQKHYLEDNGVKVIIFDKSQAPHSTPLTEPGETAEKVTEIIRTDIK